MKTLHRSFRLAVLPATLMAAFGCALAEEPDVDELTKPDSSVSVGVGSWSADRRQQGIYDGMREGKAYGLLDADIVKRDEETGTWLKLKATDLGLDTRELRGDYIRQGDFGGFLEYNRTTRENPLTYNTRLQGIGSDNLTLGTGLGSFPRRDVELGTTREMTRLGGFKTLVPGLELKIDFKNEEKTGTRQTGWGSAALFSVEPVDSTTRQLEAILQYTGTKLQLSGGYYGSWYDNHETMVLQRFNGVSGGTSASLNSVTPLSLPLGNQAHQAFFEGGYAFTPTTRGTFKLAYTRATQDETLPSYGLGGANAPFINAPSSLNGRVDTTLVQLGLSSRPLPKLSITGSLRYYDVDDKTPLRGFVGSNATGVATVFNTPQSYTTTSGKLEATYRLPQNFSLTGGVEYSDQDRSRPTVGTVYVPFRSRVQESTYKVQVKRSLADSLNGSLAYLRSDRDGSAYSEAESAVENQINPMHIADRQRDKWRAAFDWEPAESLSLQFRVDVADDRYPRDGRQYGLRDGSARIYAIDGTYVISDDWKVSAWYSYDVTRARTVGYRASGTGAATADKETRIKDVGDSFGFSVRGNLSARMEVGAGFDWFRNTSSYPQSFVLSGAGNAYPTGATGPVPDVSNRLLRLRLDGKYAIDKTSEVRLDLIHERWRTNDWSWNLADGSPFSYYSGNVTCTGCSPSATVNVQDGTTVRYDQRQTDTFVGIRYIYRLR